MGGRHPKHWHCAIYAPDEKADFIPIPEQLWKLYEEDRDMKRGLPVRKLAKDGDPLFYLLDEHGNLVFFGPTQMFRLPYDKGILEFVPHHLRDENATDMAEAIFGYVKSEQMPYGKSRACAGRVFFSDAVALPGQGELTSDSIVTPQILSSPKPSTFQHYLTQPDEAARNRANLRHYASITPDQTVVRGHKLYWHRKDIELSDYTYQGSSEDREEHKKQLTGIQPVCPGARFAFRVYFENLTDEELGALLWALELPAGCAHKLGMGKPLGLGSARISVLKLTLTDRRRRYSALFADTQWADGSGDGTGNNQKAHFKRCFEQHLLLAITPEDRGDAASFAETPRMRELLTLLSHQNSPKGEQARYMTIEPLNEYSERPVLALASSIQPVDIHEMLQQPIPEPSPMPQSKPVSASASAPQRAVLLTKPQNKRAQVRIESGAELDCRGFSSFAKEEPGTVCLVRVIVASDGKPLRAEFINWEVSA